VLGAIAGDVIGSVYEFNNIKTTQFELFSPGSTFTDDTVLTIAVADCIMHRGDYAAYLKEYGLQYPGAGYGGRFLNWLHSPSAEPYNSWGNGSAMRVSPVGFAFSSLEEVLFEARRSALPTHNHPEGIKGAQATAAAIFLARRGESKEEIKKYLTRTFGYNLERTLEEIRPHYRFDVSCAGTLPPAFTAFLESEDFEDAIRKAVSLGGDSDTIACIVGGIAQAYYGQVPDWIAEKAISLLPREFQEVVSKFNRWAGIEK